MPLAKRAGFRLVKAGNGSALCEMRVRKGHENPVGCVHGGILCEVADAAMGCAFTTLLAPGEKGVTERFQIHFLRPVFTPNRLAAKAKVLARGKSASRLECELWTSEGKLAAKAAAIFKTFGSA